MITHLIQTPYKIYQSLLALLDSKRPASPYRPLSLTMAGLLLFCSESYASEPPNFFKNSLPEHAIQQILESYGTYRGEKAVLDVRTRELIALGVSAQIPCDFCIYAHRRNALAAGASDAELREAVAAGAFVRFWSTMFQGAEIDFDAFKAELDALR